MYRNNGTGLLGVGGIILLILLFGVMCGMEHSNRERTTIEVQEKEFVVHGDDVHHYLIWATDGRVFSLDDSLVEGQWDTSTLYGRMHEGHCYNIEVYGWRVPFLSWYQNISDIQEVNCAH